MGRWERVNGERSCIIWWWRSHIHGIILGRRCDGAIFIRTDAGDVTEAMFSNKVFLVETSTGDVDVPRTTAGGWCEIETDTGNVRISIAGR